MRFIARGIVSALVCLLLAGCLTPGTVQLQPQYVINPDITPVVTEGMPVTVGLRAITAARPYQTLQMAWFRAEDAQVAYYAEGQWAEMPATVLTRALLDTLAASQHFADVGGAAEMARPDWMLTGELRKFHELRTSEGTQAQIEVRLELRAARDKALLWAETLRAEQPLQGATPQALAAAMQAAIAQIAQAAAAKIIAVPATD